MWFRKLRSALIPRKTIKKYEFLVKINPGDRINITTPKGYTKNVGGHDYTDLPVVVDVVNNDPINRKLWISLTLKNDSKLDRIISYNSYELSDYILLNKKPIRDLDVKGNSKEELKKELEIAISNDNFEMAAIINKKLKDIS